MSSANVPGDREQLLEWLDGYILTQLLYTVCELGIPDLIAEAPKTAEELATSSKTDARFLYRVLRALAMFAIFSEQEDRRFAQTPKSALLRSNRSGSLQPFALTYGQPWWWSSVGNLLEAVKTGRNGFEIEHGMPFFEYLDLHPQAGAIFNANMKASTQGAMRAILKAYPFPNQGILVDIGGGHGGLAEAVLEENDQLHGVIYDLPSVVTTATERLAHSPIRERMQLVGGDFFTSIPSGGSMYCLKDILHDWDDADSLRILKNCRNAMAPPSKIVLIERHIPPNNQPAVGKKIDILMLLLTGGQERTNQEYEDLLNTSGFKVTRIVPTDLQTNIFEAIPV